MSIILFDDRVEACLYVFGGIIQDGSSNSEITNDFYKLQMGISLHPTIIILIRDICMAKNIYKKDPKASIWPYDSVYWLKSPYFWGKVG